MTAPSHSRLNQRVRVAARTLARHGLVQAWGHCSARIDDDCFVVCASRPMSRIAPGESGTVVRIDAPLPPSVLGEVRIHQQIYRLRSDVGGVCRVMPPVTTALSTLGITPSPRHGVGAFNAACRFWDDIRLLRDDGLARELAVSLDDAPSLVMRGNGAVTAAANVELAACLAWCLEDAARVEQLVRSASDPGTVASTRLSTQDVQARQVSSGAVFERLWEHLSADDPEFVAETDGFPAVNWGRLP